MNSTVENYVKNHREAYDALVCSEVIEHVEHPEFFVAKCVELVKVK